MNDEAFSRLVAEEVKNRVSKSQREFLKMPDNWNRWQRALLALCGNLDKQLDALSLDEERDRDRYVNLGDDGRVLLAEAMSEYEVRRSKVTRFKFHVEKRLDEVTRMIALGFQDADADVNAAVFLRTAILKHRELMTEFDLEPTAIDWALYDSLDSIWSFDKVSGDDL